MTLGERHCHAFVAIEGIRLPEVKVGYSRPIQSPVKTALYSCIGCARPTAKGSVHVDTLSFSSSSPAQFMKCIDCWEQGTRKYHPIYVT